MSENWLFLPRLHLHLLLLGLYSHLPLPCKSQTPPIFFSFSFIALVSQNPLGRDSHCWHLWHPPQSSFPEKWADVCLCTRLCIIASLCLCACCRVYIKRSVCLCACLRATSFRCTCMAGHPCFVCIVMYFPKCVHACAFFTLNRCTCACTVCECVA